MMKKIIDVLLLALLATLVWTYEIPAASWDFIYECDKLPNDFAALKDKVWWVYSTPGATTSDVYEITAKKELHITALNDVMCFFMRKVEDAEKATVEARVKVLSRSGVGYTIFLGIEDDDSYTWLYLFPDRVKLKGGKSHNVDMTDYHILRIAKDGNDVTIYVNDKKVIEGQPSGTGPRKSKIVFGANPNLQPGAGEHYWDYVVYTTAGAFSPKEFPNFRHVSNFLKN